MSCQTGDSVFQREYPELTEDSGSGYATETIDKLILNGQNLRAIPVLFKRERQGYVETERYNMALSNLEKEWRDSRQSGDWQQSLVILRSLNVLGDYEITGNITEAELILEGVEEYLDKGLTGVAAVLAQSESIRDAIDSDRKKRWAKIFVDKGFDSVARLLENKGDPLPDGELNTPTLQDLVRGTVTVWVDRGIRLEGRVGVPDRRIGSAFYVDTDGYLLTNYHVIESEVDPAYQGYSRLYVKEDVDSSYRIPARVIGYSKTFDLALIKTETSGSYIFNFANSNQLLLGEPIRAIGSPGGLSQSLTSGTISAFARSLQPMAGSLQIDVPINPGNSGGPLLNTDGEVIGVVFAGAEDFEGVNFAIPGSYVKQILPGLFTDGSLELSYIGLVGWDVTGSISITYVIPGSPASVVGLRKGDIIEKVDGLEFESIRQLQQYLLDRAPETLIKISITRNNQAEDIIVSLGTRPEIPMEVALEKDFRENLLSPLFGFEMEQISGRRYNRRFRLTNVYPGSIADESGFSMGDVVALHRWVVDSDLEAVFIQMIIRGRKAGFLDKAVQMGQYLNINTVF